MGNLKKTPREVTVAVRVTADMADGIRALAQRDHNGNQSVVIRRMLHAGLALLGGVQ